MSLQAETTSMAGIANGSDTVGKTNGGAKDSPWAIAKQMTATMCRQPKEGHWLGVRLGSGVLDRPQQVSREGVFPRRPGRARTLDPQRHHRRQDFPEHSRRDSRMAAMMLTKKSSLYRSA